MGAVNMGTGSPSTSFLAPLLVSWYGDNTTSNPNRCHLLNTYHTVGTMGLASPVFITLTTTVFKTEKARRSPVTCSMPPSWLSSRAQLQPRSQSSSPTSTLSDACTGLFWCVPSSSSGSLPLLSNTHPFTTLVLQ